MSADKTIDGLAVRRATSSHAVKIKSPKHATASAFALKKKSTHTQTPKGDLNDPLNQKAKQTRAEESAAASISAPRPAKKSASSAHKDFLKPVETFDFNITSDELKKPKHKAKPDKKAAPLKIKKKPSKLRRITTTTLLVLVICLIGAVIWLLIWGNDIITKLTGGNSDIWSAIGALTSDTYVDLKTDANGRTNILVFGTSGYDMNGTVGNKHHDGSQLTDSIMVIGIDQTSGDIVMTSLPRDLKVPGACYAGKINEIYLCNNKKGQDDAAGAEALTRTVSTVLGLDFQYYVHINWGSLVQIVDSLGGITVTLDEDINDKNYTGAVYKAGVPVTLDGEAALGLARARHGTVGGDFTRGTSQQKILIGIKDRITTKMQEGSFDLGTALSLVQALGDNLRTNIAIDEIKTGVHLLGELDLNQMRQVMVYNYNDRANSYMKTANINGLSFVIPTAGEGNYTKIHEMIAREFSTDTIKREAAKILILNGSGQTGLAAAESKSLTDEGYNIAKLDNAPQGDYPDRYAIYLMNDKVLGTAKALHGLYNVELRPVTELPAGINTSAYDIVMILGGPSD